MRVRTSRKGLYLTVMAMVAFLFVLYLFVSPTFVFDGNPVPPMALFIGVAGAIGAIALILGIWRNRLKHDVSLHREEGVVSGQNEHPVKS